MGFQHGFKRCACRTCRNYRSMHIGGGLGSSLCMGYIYHRRKDIYMKLPLTIEDNKSFIFCCDVIEESPDQPHGGFI